MGEIQRNAEIEREELEQEQHKKFQARIKKREEAQLKQQVIDKKKNSKAIKPIKESDSTSDVDDVENAGNLKIINMAE